MLNGSQFNRAQLNRRAYLLRPVAGSAAASSSAATAAAAIATRSGKAGATVSSTVLATSLRSAAGRTVMASSSATQAACTAYRGGTAHLVSGASITAFAPHLINLSVALSASATLTAIGNGYLGASWLSAGATLSAGANKVKLAAVTGIARATLTGDAGSVINLASAWMVGQANTLVSARQNHLNTGLLDFIAESRMTATAGKQTQVVRPFSSTSVLTAVGSRVLPGWPEPIVCQSTTVAVGLGVTPVEGAFSASASLSAQGVRIRLGAAGWSAQASLSGTPWQYQHGSAAFQTTATTAASAWESRGAVAHLSASASLTTPYLMLFRGGSAVMGCTASVTAEGDNYVLAEVNLVGAAVLGGAPDRVRTLPPRVDMEAGATLRAVFTNYRHASASWSSASTFTVYADRLRLGRASILASSQMSSDGITNAAVRAPSERVVMVLADHRNLSILPSPRAMEVV